MQWLTQSLLTKKVVGSSPGSECSMQSFTGRRMSLTPKKKKEVWRLKSLPEVRRHHAANSTPARPSRAVQLLISQELLSPPVAQSTTGELTPVSQNAFFSFFVVEEKKKRRARARPPRVAGLTRVVRTRYVHRTP